MRGGIIPKKCERVESSKWEREIGRRSRRGKGKQNGGKRREEWGKREQAGGG